MAPLGVVISHATTATPTLGALFEGKRFFLVQRVPSRRTYVEKIQANGGRVVKLEAQADFIIADHLRKDSPPGSISYTFIDSAIKDSALPNPDDHRAGPSPGATRAVGSAVAPPKATRTAFTAEDDRDLWIWVQEATREGKGTVKGNEIYKQLEAVNPRHTFQAWRDRYVKRLINRRPEGFEDIGLEEKEGRPGVHDDGQDRRADQQTQQGSQDEDVESQEDQQSAYDSGPLETIERTRLKENKGPGEKWVSGSEFMKVGLEGLLQNAKYILEIPVDTYEAAWEAWAEEQEILTAKEWRKYWEDTVLPIHQERRKLDHLKKATERQSKLQKAGSAPEQPESNSIITEPQPNAIGTTTNNAGAIAPPNLQKRKRETPTPRSKTNGNKRTRPESAVMFAPEEAEDKFMRRRELSATQSRQTSGAKAVGNVVDTDYDAAEKTEKEDYQPAFGEASVTSEDKLPKSEAHRAAQEQSLAEASHADSEPGLGDGTPSVRKSLVSTDVQTRAAYSQVAISSSAAQEEFQEGSSIRAIEQHPKSTEYHVTSTGKKKDRKSLDGAETDHHSKQPKNISSRVDLPQKGDALTEANLASQQQQHQALLMRGLDLSQDGKDVDQSDYAEFLQSVLGVSEKVEAATKPEKPQAKVPDRLMDTPEENEDVIELESDRELNPEHESAQSRPGIHVNVDVAFNQNLDWPMSPKKPPRVADSRQGAQNSEFDTQVQYPKLGQKGSQEAKADDEEFSSQPFGYPDTQIPQIPVWRDEDPLFSSQVAVEDSVEAPVTPKQRQITSRVQYQIARRKPSSEELDSSSSHVRGREAYRHRSRQGKMDDLDEDIDLTVPEPEGWSSDIDKAEEAHIKDGVERLAHEPELPDHQELSDQPMEPVEITSGGSSSYGSSEDEETNEQRTMLNGLTHDKPRAADTQAIFEAETQLPDLDLPLPLDSDSEAELPSFSRAASATPCQQLYQPIRDRSSPRNTATPIQRNSHDPPRRSSTITSRQPTATKRSRPSDSIRHSPSEAETSKTEAQHSKNEDLDAFIHRLSSAGHSIQAITHALRMTSMRKQIAEMVIYLLKAGRPLPQDVKEIWTEEEDQVAVGGNSVTLRKLTDRKGWDEYEHRVDFLSEWPEP